MARKLRIEYPGAFYHVMNRGDRREPIFNDHADRERFLPTLDRACVKAGWVHAVLHWKGQMSDAQTGAALPQKVEAQKP
jgi:hypothetical protein